MPIARLRQKKNALAFIMGTELYVILTRVISERVASIQIARLKHEQTVPNWEDYITVLELHAKIIRVERAVERLLLDLLLRLIGIGLKQYTLLSLMNACRNALSALGTLMSHLYLIGVVVQK